MSVLFIYLAFNAGCWLGPQLGLRKFTNEAQGCEGTCPRSQPLKHCSQNHGNLAPEPAHLTAAPPSRSVCTAHSSPRPRPAHRAPTTCRALCGRPRGITDTGWVLQGQRRSEPHGIHSERCRPTTLSPHTRLLPEGSCKATGPGGGSGHRVPPPDGEGPFPERPPEGACGAAAWGFALCPPARPVAPSGGGKSDRLLPAAASFWPRAPAPVGPAVMEEEEEGGGEEQQQFSYRQRLKAAVHYTVGCLCEEVASDRGMPFSKQTIAAVSELTFRQCETFAKDLEMFARHAKRSTINTEDVKLLARRSNSLLKYITEKTEELAQFNTEQKAKKKQKLEEDNTRAVVPAEAAAARKDGS
ncbi:uncharacterized protein LOC114213239 [Eumetopias jubatus]|uniref:uncharacterized protein LOC114213239 n=1 Tax=Eumetopias jubatus TaxID=34886 RepID=UPI001015F930|nr:uncharacterized protein LOC114213239 [Eumetopias jubatus]